MDRNLARKNIRSGLIVTAVCLFMFGMTFVAAAHLRLMSPLDPEVPPAGEEIHLPGPQHAAACCSRSASPSRSSA